MAVSVRNALLPRSRRRRRPSLLTADGALVRFALQQGSLQQIEKLLFGTQQRFTDLPLSDGQLPLHVAVDANRPEIIVYLLNYGAQVNKADLAGWTALHHAVYNGNINIVKILLSHGADPTVRAGDLLPIDLTMDFDINMKDMLREAPMLPASRSTEEAETTRGSESKMAQTDGGKHLSKQVVNPKLPCKGVVNRTALLLKKGAGGIRAMSCVRPSYEC